MTKKMCTCQHDFMKYRESIPWLNLNPWRAFLMVVLPRVVCIHEIIYYPVMVLQSSIHAGILVACILFSKRQCGATWPMVTTQHRNTVHIWNIYIYIYVCVCVRNVPRCTVQNGDGHISVLSGALRDSLTDELWDLQDWSTDVIVWQTCPNSFAVLTIWYLYGDVTLVTYCILSRQSKNDISAACCAHGNC